MKILKLLNKKYLSIFIIFVLSFSFNSKAEEEPIDIWNLEKKNEQSTSATTLENDAPSEIDVKNSDPNNAINTIDSDPLGENEISIAGLYDPEDHGLNIEKTQICLNLKLTKVICNSTKIQVQAKQLQLDWLLNLFLD